MGIESDREHGNLQNIKGKRVLVVGLGRSGIAALQAMVKLGAIVSVQDSKDPHAFNGQLLNFLRSTMGDALTLYLGEEPDDATLAQFDMLILSPGVSPELPFIQRAQALGAEIVGELEIAFRIGRGHFVAITGTNGKTTTTTLTGEMFRNAGRTTHVVGNIGVAVISKALDADEDDWLVTETSSFQLQTTRYFKPVISAILNLTPDHLDRHHTMEAYGAAKARIFANQDAAGYCIVNYDDKACWDLVKGCRAKVVPFSRREVLPFGAFLSDGKLALRDENGRLVTFCGAEELTIIGDHNIENALAAAAMAYFAGIEPAVISKTLRGFQGVPHRIEFSGEIDGVRYYNDSKGTNVDATITALKAVGENVILIAGGDGKSQDFSPLVPYIQTCVKHMILLGRDGPKIAEVAQKAGFTAISYGKDMGECVKKAHDMAVSGDTVLLSPACASWDMYDNFEQRGDHFKACVAQLGGW